MKLTKPFFVVGLMFALGPIAVVGCSSGGDEGDEGSGGSGGEASGGDGGDSEGGKGGSASGGKGGSSSGGKGGSASGGSGGTASGGGGGTSAGGGGGTNSGGASGGGGAAGGASGGAGGTNAGGAGGTSAVTAKFATDIAPILKAKCSGCHGNQYETTTGAYTRLMGDAMGDCAGQKRMTAGNAANSLVVKKVKGAAGICGSKMPRVGNAVCTGDACLSADQIAKLESWINAGALNN